jgi:hypothetical protein
MRGSRWSLTVAAIVVSAAALLVLHACRETRPTEPDLAVAVQKTLTVTGSGTGTGIVTSVPAGINCTITAGVAARTGCIASFVKGTVVTLTAIPKADHSFLTWAGYCTGSGTCRAPMSANRGVRARFLVGPFVVKIGSGTLGAGSGTVRSQPGLTPAINCVITNGAPSKTGCSGKYPAYTTLTLTATPAANFAFSGWGAPCGGDGPCQYSVLQGRTIPATFTPIASATAATQGRWGALFANPVVAIHMHLMPTGKVLLWGHKGAAQLWDAESGFSPVTKTYELFCSGHTLLADGRLFVAGGHIDADRGLPLTAIFDPASSAFASSESMAQGRWYPTLTVLPDGEVLTVAGADEQAVMVPVPEVWGPGGWRRLTTASLALPYYPAMFVAPNGKVFMAGPDLTTRYLDVGGTGGWTTVADRHVADRDAGSGVMYAPGKVLFTGGGDPPVASAEVIDLNDVSPSWRTVAPMAFPRRHTLATLLADGQVLVTHGTSGPGFNDLTHPVYYPELWNPATETWTTMAKESAPRMYHATAVLLPDARVLSTGSGEGDGVSFSDSELSAQVFSPPYLFNPDGSLADRPVITSAPGTIGYGAPIVVESPDAATVTRGTLIRLGSATHSFNQSQVIYPLSFTGSGTTLTAEGPPSAHLAPPGPYMLFLLTDKGVPSKARMVTVGP